MTEALTAMFIAVFDHHKLNNKTLIRGNIPTQLTLNSFSECVCAKKSVLFEFRRSLGSLDRVRIF